MALFRKAPWRQIGTVLIIVNAAPIGSNIAVYAQRLGLDSSYAVQMVCLSTLLSLIAASDAQPGCRVGLCMSLKTTNRKQEIR